MNRIFSFNPTVSALKWDDLDPAKKEKLVKRIGKLSVRIAAAVNGADHARANLVRSVLFHAMKSMMKKNDWNLHDRNHWERNGWLSGKKPY